MSHKRPLSHLRAAPDLRIIQIDALRGLALLGIYWINVVIFAFPHGAYAWPNLLGEGDQANIAHWAFSDVFVEGTMRGLFSMLFGASALIFLDEARLQSRGGLQIVDLYYRRNLILIGFGLIHAYLLLAQWDLLFAYGLFAFFLFPLRNLTAKALAISGLSLLVIGDLFTFYNGFGDEEQEALRQLTGVAVGERMEELREATIAGMQTDAIVYLSGYFDILAYQMPLVAAQESTEMYNDHVFDIGGMMLIGMALYKLGVFSGKASIKTLLIMSCIGYTVGCSLRIFEIYQIWSVDFDTERRDPWLVMPYNVGRLCVALGHIGLFCALMQSRLAHPVVRYLAAVGRLALTNYVGQTVISAFIFFGFGLGLFAYFERYQLMYVCLAVWALQLVASHFYLKRYRIGPLEWLWRSLTYGRRQPIRGAAPAG